MPLTGTSAKRYEIDLREGSIATVGRAESDYERVGCCPRRKLNADSSSAREREEARSKCQMAQSPAGHGKE